MRFIHTVRALNDRVADFTLGVMTWSVWVNVLTVGISLWLIIDQISHDHFDPQKTTLVLILTIQTALSSEASNLRNRRERVKEEARESQMRQQIESIETLAIDIKNIADVIADEQMRVRERDEAAVQRDGVLIDLSAQLVSRLEEMKGTV